MNYEALVKPGSKKGPLVEPDRQGGFTVYVRERALEGQANDAVIRLLAEHFGVPKSQVSIVRGHTARRKLVHVIH